MHNNYDFDEESSIGVSERSARSSFDEPLVFSAHCPEKVHIRGVCFDEKDSNAEALPTYKSTTYHTGNNDVWQPALSPIPSKANGRTYRLLRWTLLSTYRRLFSSVLLCNLSALIGLLVTSSWRSEVLTYSPLATATSANLLVSMLVRQEHVINLLFMLSCSLPVSSPLIVRRCTAKIYSYGGIHSGCGLAAITWYLAFTGLVIKHIIVEPIVHPAVAGTTLGIVLLLLGIAVFSHPRLRAHVHDWFEVSHRFAGWTVVALFWVQVMILSGLESGFRHPYYGRELIKTPSFWMLLIVTLCVVYPWTRLRYRTVRPEPLSNHAIRLHFNYATPECCMGVRMTHSPLRETHAFASIPYANKSQGFSVIVSNAGDWTDRMIRNPPTRLWTRGVPMYGVLRVATLFKRTVIVATGSGIGPCLSLFKGRPDHKCRILWSTPSPLATYGQEILDDVLAMDPQAIIIDTRKFVRPDMVALSHQLYKQSGGEAVVIISNPKVTRKVVYGLETRGVPAYGPIFDS